jgi:polyisoprenoid-binding protein YceI
MFTKKTLLTILSLMIGVIGYAQSIDSARSTATFEISNMRFNKVEGTVSGMTGNITFDTDNLEICSFDVCMDASTINTGNEKRDEHLQQAEYFNTEQYDNICFESKEVSNAEQGGFAVIGSLTMRDVTKDVMIPFTFDGNTFNGNLKLSRYDYNIGADVGKFMIGEQVDIVITCYVL